MQDRILSAPAMNGGFTTLLYKVENIEQSQEKLVEKVDQIHEVLYEPDNGLYARVKNVENQAIPSETVDNLEKEIQNIKYWREVEEKTAEKDHASSEEHSKMLKEHDDIIREIQESVIKFQSGLRWAVVTFGGGILSVFGKMLYDYISSQIGRAHV